MHPFNGFPFVDARARAALLSALLTAAVRPILPTAPAHGFDAPTVGSGKTLLARCIGRSSRGTIRGSYPSPMIATTRRCGSG